jgi:hypothetical protein
VKLVNHVVIVLPYNCLYGIDLIVVPAFVGCRQCIQVGIVYDEETVASCLLWCIRVRVYVRVACCCCTFVDTVTSSSSFRSLTQVSLAHLSCAPVSH